MKKDMKKIYIAPSVETVNVKKMTIIATSAGVDKGKGASDHYADSKAVDFAGESDSFWSSDK